MINTIDRNRGSHRALAVSVDRGVMRRVLTVTAAVLFSVLGFTSVASAATIGGLAATKLFTQILAGPSLGIVDTFKGTGSSTLAGRIADTGQKWTVSKGTFALNAGGTALASTSSTLLSEAWVPGTVTAYTAQIDLTRVSTATTNGGLFLNVDSLGTTGLTVVWQPGATTTGQIVFGKVTGGTTITTLNTKTGVGVPAVGSAATLTVVCDGAGTYTITYGSAASYQVVLSAADKTTFSALKNVVVVSDKNTSNLFDNLLVK